MILISLELACSVGVLTFSAEHATVLLHYWITTTHIERILWTNTDILNQLKIQVDKRLNGISYKTTVIKKKKKINEGFIYQDS